MTKDPSESASGAALAELDQRSRDIFRRIVEGYLETGEPVGSRNISKVLPIALSPATVRNVMQDLEDLGLVYAPHVSAGRLPTEQGLRLFVDSILEIGDIPAEDRARIETQLAAGGSRRSFEDALAEATSLLSGVSRGAGVVVTSKSNKRLKHIEFVRLDPSQALVVLVADDGSVENRLVALPPGLPASALIEASNYLNHRLKGRTIGEVRAEIAANRAAMEAEISALTSRLVEAGLASTADEAGEMRLIVRGQANLLEDLTALADLERMRRLFADLEREKDVIDLLSRAEEGDGVRIFIGSENKLFSLSGSSMIAAPFRDSSQKIVGIVGVIGPTRLNYARIVPMVDYTARVMGKLLERG
ncbi:heat-inducible transcriptional repressor HrcA [Rhabdaerophilum calidifontis]|uniref:heat-inducible transcriptional repressor HrcA n=1 Tax=Rhabdaerophilum calidifontis TaxID=2604328 RepID=UPI00123BAD2D|nr:heat-inducible transcriptional repressor HrcA [Rhabdaerophilum calidifontis]